MANATAITVHSLTRDATAAIVPDTFDTETSPVVVYAAAAGAAAERVILKITNSATVALGVSVAGCSTPASYKGTVPALANTAVGASSSACFGPFTRERFEQADGSLKLTLTPVTTATMSATVTCFKLPA